MVVEAAFVVDCSGRRSLVARRQGARRQRIDRLVACAALFAADADDLDATTLVESTQDGWWYTARLPDATRIVMFMTDGDLPGRRVTRVPAAFMAALATTAHVGRAASAPQRRLQIPPWVVAADTGRLDRVGGDGWIAAGDAAATFDPVSSQGIMTALRLGQLAAEVALGAHAAAYAATVDALFDRYLAARAAVYAQERRFPQAPFWARRQRAAARA